jgi:enolase-phosphatase E1
VPPIDLRVVRVILLDIEGTTTPLDFVHRTLFGYARDNFRRFLERNYTDAGVSRQIAILKEQYANDADAKKALPVWSATDSPSEISSATQYALLLMDRDSKSGPLKSLQGLIWQEGYRSRKLKGEVYPDVPRAFEHWRQDKTIYIYSSGSELAQRLLFSSTSFGDLTAYIRGFFDTRVGAKISVESYRKIATSIGAAENQILFLSDVERELDAARSAGMQTALVVRGEEPSSSAHPMIKTFDEFA